MNYLCSMGKKRIAFHTFGCKLNYAETSAIARKFTADAYNTVDFKEKADIYVIHSCTVTAAAEKKCKAAIRQAVRRNPDASVAVIGCYSQVKPDELLRMPGVKIVLGNNEKYKLYDVIENSAANADDPADYHGHIMDHDNSTSYASNSDIKTSRIFQPGYSVSDRTRSFFKVQDGCDYFCTYCAIPFARGRSRSASIQDTLTVAQEIASTDVKEIVLTGVNIGDFGRQYDQSFYELLLELKQLDGIDRIRISSIEPELLEDRIIELVNSSEKLMPHFHIPLQSGNDRILTLMKRKYKREVFESRVLKIKRLMPDACIAADVITGFPGETKEEFDDTFNFINSLGISYLHVFPYSSRPNTKAKEMEGHIADTEKAYRSMLLHNLSEIKKLAFYRQNKGTTHDVLWESDVQNNFMFGFTDNYVRCKTPFNPDLVNRIDRVKLLDIDDDDVFLVERTN